MTIEELTKFNRELLFILGATLPIVVKYKPETPDDEKLRSWLIEAVDSVLYVQENLTAHLMKLGAE